MDRLALKFHETKELKLRDEIYRLCRELMKLNERSDLRLQSMREVYASNLSNGMIAIAF